MIEPLAWIEGRRRLAVICRVNVEREAADVMLVHPYPELATDADAVIDDPDSDLAHPLVVQCHMRGWVWLRQVRERLGVLSEDLLQVVGRVVADSHPQVEGTHSGLPLAGPGDPRWQFKDQESVELQTLVDDCTAALLDDDDAWQLDPDLLRPETGRCSIRGIARGVVTDASGSHRKALGFLPC